MKEKYQLHLVTEESIPLDELLRTVEAAVKGGVTIVQLREKKSTGRDFFKKAQSLKALLANYNVPLIINDRVDIALAVCADGIHIGQKDLPLAEVRKIVPPSMIVGLSVSTVAEALEAEKNGASYIGVGSVFPTRTKGDANVLPADMLASIASAVSIPAVAIGGISLENISRIHTNNLAGIAVVSAIMGAENPYEAAMTFRKNWQ